MSRSFSNSNLISALLLENISSALKSRGYAAGAATEGGVSGKSKMMFRKGGEEGSKSATSSAATTWVPDPKTGYYRPDSGINEIDAADLRQLLLNHKIQKN